LSQQRKELHGFVDYFAIFGGLLGLCLGVSAISFLEIVYFCMIRLWFVSRESGRADWREVVFVKEFRKTRTKTNRCLTMVKELFIDYFNKATIQGIKYAADSSLNLIERIWWTIVVVFSIFCCGSLIADVFRRYDQSPVTISYADEETPISHVGYFLSSI
jgi:Amiloride-sensitive sodium channel